MLNRLVVLLSESGQRGGLLRHTRHYTLGGGGMKKAKRMLSRWGRGGHIKLYEQRGGGLSSALRKQDTEQKSRINIQ